MVTSESPFVHLIITARTRCLGQGNVFTRVCLPLRGGGSLPPGWSASRGVCLEGVCFHGGLHTGGSASGGRPPPPDTWDTTRNGEQTGGPHPTVMRSCFNLYFSFFLFFLQQASVFDLFASSISEGTQCSGSACSYNPPNPPPEPLTCDDNPCPEGKQCCSFDHGEYQTCCASSQICFERACIQFWIKYWMKLNSVPNSWLMEHHVTRMILPRKTSMVWLAVAGPGFFMWSAPPYYFAKVFRKLHERIWTDRTPLGSATVEHLISEGSITQAPRFLRGDTVCKFFVLIFFLVQRSIGINIWQALVLFIFAISITPSCLGG